MTTPAIRRRRAEAKFGIGLPGDNTQILDVARRLTATVDAPVLGGIAVYLYGVRRTTTDLDLYTTDRQITDAELEATGARWSRARREHVLDHVRIHTVTPEDAGVTIEKTSIIDGIRVVTLTDLIAIKLLCGLRQPARGRDIGDVQELIRAIPLDKRFAAKLPKSVRQEFKALVDVVRAGDRSAPPDRRF